MSIFSYPVELTAAELKTETGLDVTKEYGASGQKIFLHSVYASVYEGGIYATGDREIKDRIITAHKEKTENAIKRALVLQAMYMHDQGNVGTESGVTITADGQKAVVSKSDLRSKNICISAMDALKACSIPLLYAGDDQ